MYETSQIELSRGALHHNLKFIKKLLKPHVRFCSVVKGNAYGHGLVEFVQMLVAEGVDYVGVHAAEEAYELKSKLVKAPDIFIMGAIDREAITWAIKEKIEFSVFDFERLNQAIAVAKLLQSKAIIHIELETGMRRTGFVEGDIPTLCSLLKEQSDFITLQGIFTHFAGAESVSNHFRVAQQQEIFDRVFAYFLSQDLQPKYHHTSCSAALLNYGDAPGNMVRVGILQYGYWPNMETYTRYCLSANATDDGLKKIIKWRSKVMSVQEVQKGNFVGYGTAFLAHKNMRLAVVPIGYAHGYGRNLSNVGSVLINGKNAPVIGTINMNSLTADITNCGDVQQGDEVILIGKQKGKIITVNSFSEQSQLLNYEMLTRLPLNIPRLITK